MGERDATHTEQPDDQRRVAVVALTATQTQQAHRQRHHGRQQRQPQEVGEKHPETEQQVREGTDRCDQHTSAQNDCRGVWEDGARQQQAGDRPNQGEHHQDQCVVTQRDLWAAHADQG